MLPRVTLFIVVLLLLGGIYEFTLRDRPVKGGRTVLRVAAEGWIIFEFNLPAHARRFSQEHPDIEVQLMQTPQDYDSLLMLQATVNDLPYDLVLGPTNYSIVNYARRGVVLPLDEIIGEDIKADMFPGMLAAAQFDGRTYALPFMGEAQVLNYRTDKFAQAGLSAPPRTWEEFEQYARTLTAVRSSPPIYGTSLVLGQPFFFAQNSFLPLLQSFGGTTVDADGHIDLTGPGAVETLRTLKRWIRSGIVSPASLTTTGAADDYKSGLACMFPNWQSRGYWVVLQNASLAGKVGWAPLPESQRVGSLFAFHGGVILRGTRHPQEAARFLLEVMMDRAQGDIVAAGKMPVLRSRYVSGGVPDWMLEVGRTLEKSYSAPEPGDFVEISTYIAVAFKDYLDSGSDDPRPFLENAAREVRRGVYWQHRR